MMVATFEALLHTDNNGEGYLKNQLMNVITFTNIGGFFPQWILFHGFQIFSIYHQS